MPTRGRSNQECILFKCIEQIVCCPVRCCVACTAITCICAAHGIDKCRNCCNKTKVHKYQASPEIYNDPNCTGSIEPIVVFV